MGGCKGRGGGGRLEKISPGTRLDCHRCQWTIRFGRGSVDGFRFSYRARCLKASTQPGCSAGPRAHQSELMQLERSCAAKLFHVPSSRNGAFFRTRCVDRGSPFLKKNAATACVKRKNWAAAVDFSLKHIRLVSAL